jgi:hypothetical protein
VQEHLVQVANVRVTGSKSNFLRTVRISEGMVGQVDFLRVDFPRVDFPSVVLRRRFKRPRTALHHGRVTCPKTFKIKAMSMVRSMAGLALWYLCLKQGPIRDLAV